MRRLLFCSLGLLFMGCASTVQRKNPQDMMFPEVSGTSLDGKAWTFPRDMAGEKVVLLVGYDQDAQFDIDRWLIGLDMKKYKVNVFEVPTIKGWVPRLIAGRIDEGMRSGIPEELWKVVVTVYKDAEKIVNFTGNEDGLNARVIGLDEKGVVRFFHDRGFSVTALNQLGDFLPKGIKKGDCK